MRILIGMLTLGLLVAPASANLLSSAQGDFEEPDNADGWQGPLEWDSTIHGPGAAKVGAHYGSVQTGGGGSDAREITLTSITVPPSEIVTLTGYVAGGTLNGTPADLYIRLIDGSSTDDVVVGEWAVTLPQTYGFGWTPFQMSGHINSGHVKITAGFHIGSWSSGTAVHLDGLQLVPEPASLALLALAGLPLLRRRRA